MKILSEYQVNAINEIEDYAIIFMDINGKILDWNKGAEKIKGYTAEEIIGKSFRTFYTDASIVEGRPDFLLNQALNTGKAQDEGWRVRKDGTLFWGSITLNAIKNDDGEPIGLCKITRDLTERRLADIEREKNNEDLRKKNQELEQFAYIASHDLQEPLRTISSISDLICNRYQSSMDEDGKKSLFFISEASKRMRLLINGLLEYSRLGRSQKMTDLDINQVVLDMEKDLAVSILESNAVIVRKYLPIVNVFDLEFRVLILNLLTNAIKFRKPDVSPVIEIGARSADDHWEFYVRDNGIGIKEMYWEQIFTIYQRLHARDEFVGIGVGLAFCKKVIELHGGKMWVDSQLGEGTTFYFTLPKELR